jgi:hypothetical protein
MLILQSEATHEDQAAVAQLVVLLLDSFFDFHSDSYFNARGLSNNQGLSLSIEYEKL